MRHWQQSVSHSRNRKARRKEMLRRLVNMRTAKERKRQKRIADGWTPEPRMKAARESSLLVIALDQRTGVWASFLFKSVRDVARRFSVVRWMYLSYR